ncbi:MAG: secondary thiamine-phosphate synthase enzyme YjbQ [Ignavibacteria bacterium]|jgi:secondary thiamine-phosphate synthase enzyme
MKVKTTNFSVYTEGNTELIDITDKVNQQLREVGFSEGNVLVFVPGSTAGITTIEYEPGLIQDYPQFFEKIIPSNQTYHHNETWHDGNGHSHVRASLQGNSITVPFAGGKLLLGTWQQIILIDFDIRSRQRNIITQFIGE